MTATRQGNLIAPSPVFYGLLAGVVVLGGLLWRGYDFGGFTIFLFVVAGWVLSLAFHEFGHAIVAYIGGDRSVVDKGYLTLDVRKYVDVGTSLLFPVVILIMGGIGLPGGAVWINTGAIRSRNMQSLMSLAGPAASGLCALVCLLPIRFGLVDESNVPFIYALAFLGWIQVIAMIFNLLPVPGLDGFGVIEPHLSPETRRSLYPIRQYGMIILFVLIFFVEPFQDAFFGLTDGITEILGGDRTPGWRSDGYRAFRFWER